MSISGVNIDGYRTYPAYRLCGTLLVALLLVLGTGAVEAAHPRSCAATASCLSAHSPTADQPDLKVTGTLHREPRRRKH